MQLDKQSLNRLMKLNDNQLRTVLAGLLAEYGVDTGKVPLQTMDMSALRAILQAATDEDITRFMQMFGANAANAANASNGQQPLSGGTKTQTGNRRS